MPSYHWLERKKTDVKSLPGKIAAQQKLGVPYPAMTRDVIEQTALEQGMEIAKDLRARGAFVDPESQIIAMIAYLQKLGHFTDLRTTPSAPATDTPAPAATVKKAANTTLSHPAPH
jgi:cytochrome c oxidase cbb3-type subunit I/II